MGIRRFDSAGVRMCVLAIAVLLCHHAAFAQNGTLKVTSFPDGASVIIDGVDTGKTTPMSVSLSQGSHMVSVQIPSGGWQPDTAHGHDSGGKQ